MLDNNRNCQVNCLSKSVGPSKRLMEEPWPQCCSAVPQREITAQGTGKDPVSGPGPVLVLAFPLVVRRRPLRIQNVEVHFVADWFGPARSKPWSITFWKSPGAAME